MAYKHDIDQQRAAVHDELASHPPAPRRDLLLRLALTDLYRAGWSDQIHGEWINAVLRNRPDLSRVQLERT